jgi:hypothetical protein
MNVTITVERENQLTGEITEHEVEVEFAYHRAYRGQRDSLCGVRGAGPALEPDEPANCEFESAVRCETGEDIELTESEIERATEKAFDSLADA